jgi:hypothetical protein
MGNDWTRLTQEAGKLGGPDDLRARYRAKGRAEAAAGLLALTLAGAVVKRAVGALRGRAAQAGSGEEAAGSTSDDVPETRLPRCSP